MLSLISKLKKKFFPSQSQSVEYNSVSDEMGFQKLYAYVDTDFIQKQIDEARIYLKPLENKSFFDYEKAYILDIMKNIDKVDIGEQFRLLEVMNENSDKYNFIDRHKPILNDFIDHLTNDKPISFKDIAGINASSSEASEIFVAKMAMLRIFLAISCGDNHHLTTSKRFKGKLVDIKKNLVYRHEEASLHNKAN